jgi:3-oxoacyl-[acyl-carrier-protein] synthase I
VTAADVIAVGVVTPVGLDMPGVEAAVRAGLMRFRASDLHNKLGERQVMSLVGEEYLPALVPGASGAPAWWQRALRLATFALADACAGSPLPPPLLLALPEERWVAELPEPAELFKHLSVQAGVELEAPDCRLYRQGGAGGLLALKDALTLLSARRAPFVAVGGVDTFLDVKRLALLDVEDRLTGASMDGFIPGEGAAFLLLCSPGTTRRHRLKPIARVAGVGEGVEPGHRYSDKPYRGDGLADAFRALFSAVPAGTPRVRCVYAGFNGESLPSKEWGVAYLRSTERFEEALRIEHPADCVGDVGAALGPLMLALASVGIRDRRCEEPCLVWSTSDQEVRVAALVHAVPG